MRVRTHTRILRTASTITLMFFSWSFGPLYAPVAAFAEQQKTSAGGQTRSASEIARQQPEDRFESILDSIREKVGKAGEKLAKGENESAEIEAIKAKKTELDLLDSELRKSFAETEKKLQEAKLPQQILDRHSAFVKRYADNYAQLKSEIDDIDAAKSKADRKAKIEKAKEHLTRVKPPSRHQKLDPNNLPFSARKAAKSRAPRLTPEEFQRDFPKQTSQGGQKVADGRFLTDLLPSRVQQKPVQLAFNGPDSDIPFSIAIDSNPQSAIRNSQWNVPQFAFADSSPFLLAQAASQPTADDLAETPDISFTPEIRAKAQELGYSPLKIYEWVRNNIEYAPTYGSIQGADQCLQSKICNDMDTASLLIALLRVSGVYAHYEYSTIEIPIEKAMNWVGGVTDPKMVGTILATNGIPGKTIISGSTVKAVQLEHVYVRAFIDMIPSRGAVHRQGDTWVPLDPSFKQYTYTQGIDIQKAVPFDAQAFADQLSSTATINETEGYVTNVNSGLIQQAMQDYQTQVKNYIQENHPNTTVGVVLGMKEIKKQELGILPVTLPYKIVLVGPEFAQIHDSFRAAISFSIPDPTGASLGLSYTASLPQIAGKKITLSFAPATAADQIYIESFQSNDNTTSLPAYLINLKPNISIDGISVATGAATIMGTSLSAMMLLDEPGIGLSRINNTITAGEYSAIGIDSGRIGINHLSNLKTKLLSTKFSLESGDFSNLINDDLIGDILYTTIVSYFSELDALDELTARNLNIIRYRAPSIGFFSVALGNKEVFGVPVSISQKGMMMDVDRVMQAAFSKDGDMVKVKQFMLASGKNSSALEHSVPEQLYSGQTNPVKAVSTISALKMANDQGVPIYTINQSNISTIAPELEVNENVKTDIANAVNGGKIVTVSKTNITVNNWSGCGYSITDSTTGAGAFLIEGGFNGSLIEAFFSSIVDLVSGSMNRGYMTPSRTIGLVGRLAVGATVISFGLAMYGIVMDTNLSVEQKIINIIAWTLTTCLAVAAANPILALTPWWGLLAMIAVYVTMVALALFLTTDFSDESSTS